MYSSSRISGKYETLIDRESAFEQIIKQREEAKQEVAELKEKERKEKEESRKGKRSSDNSRSKGILTTVIGTAITYFAKTFASQLARNLTKKKKR